MDTPLTLFDVCYCSRTCLAARYGIPRADLRLLTLEEKRSGYSVHSVTSFSEALISEVFDEKPLNGDIARY